MPLSYRARLRRDLRRWEESGLIEPAQAERIAAEALRAPGLAHLQRALVLCLVLLAAPSVISFVAANWAGMTPLVRLIALVLADGAAVLVAYLAARRHARKPTSAARGIADAAATLSLAVAAATIALVAQTFHLPSDPQGFAGTIAALGLVTALVARSGGAALVACGALLLADSLPDVASLVGMAGPGARPAWPGFWIVAPGLFLAGLSGWLPARSATLLLLLVVLTNHLGVAPGLPFPVTVGPDRIFLMTGLALLLARGLGGLSGRGLAARLRGGSEALSEAAAGLGLLGILDVAVRTLGARGAQPGAATVVTGAVLALWAALLVRRWRATRVAAPVGDLAVLGAVALALATWLAVCGVDPSVRRGASAFWTVWGGILPALAMVVAGHVDERRGLFGWALALAVGLTLAMLALSANLIGFSVNLLGCAVLVALALAACRWADHHTTRSVP